MRPHLQYRFRLYVAGEAPNSLRARANLAMFCRTRIPDQHTVEIVDVLQEPRRALADGIFMTPTLLSLGPGPLRRIVGSLSQMENVSLVLGFDVVAA